MVNVLNFKKDELKEYLEQNGFKKFRADQINNYMIKKFLILMK